MKTLLLLRHAKSSWSDDSLGDHDRPLNKRGRRDAPRIGRLLKERGLRPQLVISSDAVRTTATSDIVAEHGELDCVRRTTRDLYLAPPGEFLRILQDLEDELESVMLIAHNPGVETVVEALTGEYEPTPTGGLAHIQLDVERWRDVDLDGSATLVEFYRPKEIDVD